MLGAIYPAFTGLAAFATQIAVTAHNLANINTNGFITTQVDRLKTEGF